MKKLFTISILFALFGFGNVYSQIPTDGLVGYWPFNANANDESGNSYNGTVYGATLCPDRFGNANSAYNFNGSTDYIDLTNTSALDMFSGFSLVAWVNYTSGGGAIISKHVNGYLNSFSISAVYNTANLGTDISSTTISTTETYNDGNWHLFVGTYDGSMLKVYVDGLLKVSGSGTYTVGNASNIRIGNDYLLSPHNGQIDDVRIYDHALDSSETVSLYNEALCYETITVTDTLIINAVITGYHPVTFLNTIKIYPNPTMDQITIDYGNYNNMNGYTLKITNSLSQTVFTNPVNTQQSVINLSSWTGNGVYFVYLTDAQSNIIDIKKIVLQ